MKFFKKMKNKIKSKDGNSFLFMPYLVTFGVMLMYISMEMGTAYVRQIELQVVTDAGARAGVYGGMTGSGTNFYQEKNHVYVNLDDTVALGLAKAVIQDNLEHTVSLKTSSASANKGQYVIETINICNPTKTPNVLKDKKLPVWNGSDFLGYYTWVALDSGNFRTSAEVMSTGNFFVAIEGHYNTLVAFQIINKNSIKFDGFASALATATKK